MMFIAQKGSRSITQWILLTLVCLLALLLQLPTEKDCRDETLRVSLALNRTDVKLIGDYLEKPEIGVANWAIR